MSDVIEIGRHRLLCGDILDGAIEKLMDEELADIIYSDPPWGPGALSMFQTMARDASRHVWADFIAGFASCCHQHARRGAPIFVEMGIRWHDDLVSAMRSAGLALVRSWTRLYGSPSRPFILSVFADYSGRLNDVLIDAVDSGLPEHGERVTAHVVKVGIEHQIERERPVLLDPCVGLGMTARWAHAHGAMFRGVEVNDARLSRTASWLRMATQ